jgi:hypothetical protein
VSTARQACGSTDHRQHGDKFHHVHAALAVLYFSDEDGGLPKADANYL